MEESCPEEPSSSSSSPALSAAAGLSSPESFSFPSAAAAAEALPARCVPRLARRSSSSLRIGETERTSTTRLRFKRETEPLAC